MTEGDPDFISNIYIKKHVVLVKMGFLRGLCPPEEGAKLSRRCMGLGRNGSAGPGRGRPADGGASLARQGRHRTGRAPPLFAGGQWGRSERLLFLPLSVRWMRGKLGRWGVGSGGVTSWTVFDTRPQHQTRSHLTSNQHVPPPTHMCNTNQSAAQDGGPAAHTVHLKRARVHV